MSPRERTVKLEEVSPPKKSQNLRPILLTDATIEERYEKVKQRMSAQQIDSLIIYADKEHGQNFEYLTGFIPRFEEALVIIHQDAPTYLLVGNENLKMASYARVPVKPLHVPFFSLPNQPMENEISLQEVFKQAEITSDKVVGLVGWKYFTSNQVDNEKLFDFPHYVVEAIRSIAPKKLVNRIDLFIAPKDGARVTNNANEIAHYEFGAALASTCMLNALDAIEIGKTEMEIGQYLSASGQTNNVVTISATGNRFEQGNIYPTDKKIAIGDKISLTTGFRGGLSSRSGYAVFDREKLAVEQKDYLEKVVIPYFKAYRTWLETIQIGMTGGELYQRIEEVLPKAVYGWHLNPGHLVANEEWMSSPIYAASKERLQSGMLFQIDIIPSVTGYSGVSAEEGIALADEALQAKIQINYPELWERMLRRRAYIQEVLQLQIGSEVLPLSDGVGYLRPYLLNKSCAMVSD